jgi:hypothetical protein
VAVGGAPVFDRGVRLVKLGIGAEVGRRGDVAGGRDGRVEVVDLGERRGELDADLDVDGVVEVDGDVAARALDVLGAQRVPDSAAGLGDEGGELLARGASAEDGQGLGGEGLEVDGVGHNKSSAYI